MLDRGFIIRDAAGKAVRAVGAMADLTERHRAEAEIRAHAGRAHPCLAAERDGGDGLDPRPRAQPAADRARQFHQRREADRGKGIWRRAAGSGQRAGGGRIGGAAGGGDHPPAARAGVARRGLRPVGASSQADRGCRCARLRRRAPARHSPSPRARSGGAMGSRRPGPDPAGADQPGAQRGRGDAGERGRARS